MDALALVGIPGTVRVVNFVPIMLMHRDLIAVNVKQVMIKTLSLIVTNNVQSQQTAIITRRR